MGDYQQQPQQQQHHRRRRLLQVLNADDDDDDEEPKDEASPEQQPPPGSLVLGSAPYEYSYRYHVRSSSRHRRHHHNNSEDRSLHFHRHSSRSSGNYTAANYTITTSVSIRVTPLQDHFVSWGILWTLLVLASMLAAYQVYREYQALRRHKNHPHGGNSSKIRRRHHHPRTNANKADDDEDELEEDVEYDHDRGADNEGEISTADITRTLFRRLLLLAMVARTILMPVQIWSWPIWWQFVGDTLPEMIFASAWCLLVTFFVQLVGVATGTGTNTSPGIVILATAYVVYTGLIITQLVDLIATVLIYALLCVIYAALFGVIIYYCPRLWTLLQPGLAQRHSGLAWRLVLCTVLTVFVFAAHTVEYALLVVAPPKKVYWWWKYGVLELLPSAVFLAMMNTNPNKSKRNHHSSMLDHNHPHHGHNHKSSSNSVGSSGIRRVDSSNSAGGFVSRKPPPPQPPPPPPTATASSETSTLLRPGSGYGSVVVETSSNSNTLP